MNSRLLLCSFAFLEGFAVMALELSGSRIIAPVYGASFNVWAVVLAVTVGSLALGYFLGGRISERRSWQPLNAMLIFAACILVVIPFISNLIFSAWLLSSGVSSLLMVSLLFIAPAAILLSSTTPLIIHGLAETGIQSGKASGYAFALSTAGGIVGTFSSGFFLIPEHGITTTLLFTAVLLSLIPILISLLKKQVLTPSLFVVCLMISVAGSATETVEGPVNILHHEEGLMGQLLVADIAQENGVPLRAMFVNRMGQTMLYKNGHSLWSYVNYVTVAASVLSPKPDVLILGLGGGAVAKQIAAPLQANIDAVEFDPRIASLASGYFDLPPDVNVFHDDARHFISTAAGKYDLVIYDVFKGEAPPSHAFTVEAIAQLKKVLKKNALVIINFNGFINGNAGFPGRSIYRTLSKSGLNVNVLPTFEEERARNILFLASEKKYDFSKTRFQLNLNNRQVRMDSLFLDPSSFASQKALLLTDDKPILEQLNHDAAAAWRDDYTKNYTMKFSSQGLNFFR